MIQTSQALQDVAVSTDRVLERFKPDEILLGYQRRWVEDQEQLKIGEKSRRTGLTWAEACVATLAASTRADEGGCNHFYVGSKKEMAAEFILAVAMWARAFNQGAAEIEEEVFIDDGLEGKEVLTYVVRFASGHKVQALSSNPSNLRGMQGNVTLDEAAHHDRLDEVLKAALALTMWGDRVSIISTHNGADNLFNQLIQDSLAGRKSYSVHRVTLDTACAEGLYQRICQVKGKAWTPEAEQEWKAGLLQSTATEADALEEYYCIPKQGSGVYLRQTLVQRAMDETIPILRWEGGADYELLSESDRNHIIDRWCKNELLPLIKACPSDCQHSFGEDFARVGDLSVFCPLTIYPDLRRRCPFVVELRGAPYETQRRVLFFILDQLPRFIGGAFDATGNGGYLAEQARFRYGAEMIESVHLTQSWYREWMPKLKAQFEDGTIFIPKHEDVQADLAKIQVMAGIPQIDKGKSKGSDGQQRHGDFAVALAMAERATWLEGSEIEYQALPAPPELFGNPDADLDDDPLLRPRGIY